MRRPSKEQITRGTFKLIDGQWYKLCTGPAHDEGPVYLPATEKYFHIRKTTRQGELVSRCRLCVNWAKIKSPGSHHGWVPLAEVRHFFIEAANRIGAKELADRAGISYNTLTPILLGRNQYVRKATLRKVMLELISIKRKNEYSISKYAAWRVTKRANGEKSTCLGCGTHLDNFTEGCSTCWERRYNRVRRAS